MGYFGQGKTSEPTVLYKSEATSENPFRKPCHSIKKGALGYIDVYHTYKVLL